MYFDVGETVIRNLNSLLNETPTNVKEELENLSITTEAFSQNLEKFDELKYWSNLFKLQFQELLKVLEKKNKSKKVQHTQIQSKIIKRRILHMFTPLVDRNCKIQCSVKGCKLRFARRGTYLIHMDKKHPNEPKRYFVRDPVGSCRLISRLSKRECGAKLPLKGYIIKLK